MQQAKIILCKEVRCGCQNINHFIHEIVNKNSKALFAVILRLSVMLRLRDTRKPIAKVRNEAKGLGRGF
jgi:hypothetical protein